MIELQLNIERSEIRTMIAPAVKLATIVTYWLLARDLNNAFENDSQSAILT